MGISGDGGVEGKAFQVACMSLEVCEHPWGCELQVEHEVQKEQVPGMYIMLRSLQRILD